MSEIKKSLYSIYEVTFRPKEFEKKIKQIMELFIEYNDYLNNAPFDTQFLSIQLLKYEAKHSHLIEGIDTNDLELLAQDTPTSKKISNYVNALKKADIYLKENKVFDKNLLLNIHRDLFENMMSVHAINANPGTFRIKQVQIAKYYPPIPALVEEYMQEFISWLNDSTPFLDCDNTNEAFIRGAIAHAYFEKVHPFTDGNGRTGRILFNLILNKYQITTKPYFYISKAILKEQFLYYQELSKLDNNFDYQKWINFFLDLLIYQLESNIKVFKNTMNVILRIRSEIIQEQLPTHREIKKIIFEYISKYPIFTFSKVYFKCKPFFKNVDDATFVYIFNDLIKQCKIKKVPGSRHYEFSEIVSIIVDLN
ncbi:Fic family protein [Spiroplasma gladiatoris]|uniref:Fic family protein n=1 Tax=Spiroplasma gladiatoris TaxID=2143 RepID=A0A4P7AH17_9MOLU|nr:Fic family protein [Spiroplasma gladiatoris]QBQ07401.1 Fic family protein [Spiroplasma gladiatoris]